MTARISADWVLGENVAAVGFAAHNIVNLLLDQCKLTRSGANLQKLVNLESGNGFFNVVELLYVSVSTGRFADAGGASKISLFLQNKNADQNKTTQSNLSFDEKTRKGCQMCSISNCSNSPCLKKKIRVPKFNDGFDNGRHNVDLSTRRDPDETDDDRYHNFLFIFLGLIDILTVILYHLKSNTNF